MFVFWTPEYLFWENVAEAQEKKRKKKAQSRSSPMKKSENTVKIMQPSWAVINLTQSSYKEIALDALQGRLPLGLTGYFVGLHSWSDYIRRCHHSAVVNCLFTGLLVIMWDKICMNYEMGRLVTFIHLQPFNYRLGSERRGKPNYCSAALSPTFEYSSMKKGEKGH